jgi:Holliday junction DNA helicase RuvA
MLTRLPGVGKKTAERLIIEMRDKIDDLILDLPGEPLVAGAQGAVSEAVEALQALGYKPADAEKMIGSAQQQGDGQATAAQLIKAALQASVKR